jgi:hypothetical protein
LNGGSNLAERGSADRSQTGRSGVEIPPVARVPASICDSPRRTSISARSSGSASAWNGTGIQRQLVEPQAICWEIQINDSL